VSSARAQANHRLYLAKIQLAAWRRALDEQEVAASTLTQAFQPAVQQHLRSAYGYFLLAISGCEDSTAEPPGCCDELPPVPPGRSIPGEIREFQQLELGGWLAELLAQPAPGPLGERSRDNLASPVAARSGPETAAHWIQQLERLFDRMGSALDEC
jgi:hypothetical protein